MGSAADTPAVDSLIAANTSPLDLSSDQIQTVYDTLEALPPNQQADFITTFTQAYQAKATADNSPGSLGYAANEDAASNAEAAISNALPSKVSLLGGSAILIVILLLIFLILGKVATL